MRLQISIRPNNLTSIHWVDGEYEAHEDPIGLFRVPDTKAETLFKVIKDLLIRCDLPLALCRGQAYDGASNMQAEEQEWQQEFVMSNLLLFLCTARTAAIDAILKDYTVLMETLEEVHATTHDEYGLKANGCLHSLEKFGTFFGLGLAHFLFGATPSKEGYSYSGCPCWSGHRKGLLQETAFRRRI